MRLTAVILVVISAGLAAEDDPRVSDAIRRLASDDAPTRDAAQQELERLGNADESGTVDHAVEEGACSRDAEVAMRCKTILRMIRPWEHLALVRTRAGVRAVDVDTGTVVWCRNDLSESWTLPLSRRRACVTAIYANLQCVDIRTGVTVWRLADELKELKGHPTGVDGWVGSDGQRFAYVSLETGRVAWTRAGFIEMVLEGPRPSIGSLGNLLFVQAMEGVEKRLLALNARNGEIEWSFLEHRDGTFLVVPGAVYLSSQELEGGTLSRLGLETGLPVWQTAIRGHVSLLQADPCGEDEVILLQTQAGTTGIDTRTGKTLWSSEANKWYKPFHFERGTDYAWVVVEQHKGQPRGPCRLYLDAGRLEEGMADDVSTALMSLDDGGRVYVTSFWPGRWVRLWAYDKRLEKRLWTADVKGDVDAAGRGTGWLHPLEWIGKDLLLVCEGDDHDTLAVVDPATGKVRSQHVVPEPR